MAGGSQAASTRARLTRRAHLRAAGGAGLAVTTAACGGAGQTSSPPPLVQAPTQITWTFWSTPENMTYFETVGRTFEQKLPQVQVQLTPVNPSGEYEAKIVTMVSGGTPPDAMATTRPVAPDWAIKGITLALDPYLQRGGFKEGDYFSNAVSPWRYGGKLYALPREVDSWTLWYNRRLFAEAGLKPPDETWTWDTVVQNGQRLTKPDATSPQWALALSAWTHKLWVALGAQNGSKLYDRE